MSRPHSLRRRVAAAFAWLGALASLALAVGLFFAARDLGIRLMDETLQAELEDYMGRRTRNPASLPPQTVSLRGYVLPRGEGDPEMPDSLAALPPGRHDIRLDGTPFRAAVAEEGGRRFIMLFSESRHRLREVRFLYTLAGGMLVMTLLSIVGGLWLARLQAFADRERAFAADVSHELRTPLAVIQGAVEVLEDDAGLDPRLRRRVERIERAARDMAELTRALLYLAREREPSPQADEQSDLASIVSHCIEQHRHQLSPDAEVRFEAAGTPMLAAEPALVAVVAGNLIRNAFTYTQSGTVSVRIEPGRLVVSDTGIGIDPDDISRVFQRHYRGAASAGHGIGLSLVKRICDRYGWRIALESGSDGTTATLEFFPA